VFTAWYALSPYIKQIRFVFKGLTKLWCKILGFCSGVADDSVYLVYDTASFEAAYCLHLQGLLGLYSRTV
jgi:hypothetical protein